MLGENDTLRITTETTNGETEVVINLKVIAEDMNQKTNQVNLNFTCPVRMNLICHEDSAPTDAVSTETDAESKDSEVTSTYDWYE
ncbi:Citrate lyase acyl carrier protein [Trichinella pseudospiralis]